MDGGDSHKGICGVACAPAIVVADGPVDDGNSGSGGSC
jgi:hypothetical protein